MLKPSAPEAFNTMLTTGRIGEEDVLTLRESVFADGIGSRDEAEWVLALEDVCEAETPEWSQFYVEALTDHVVNRAEPSGSMSEEKARWLVDRISAGGIVKTRAGLELLLRVLESATSSPSSLAGFALQQVRAAVAEGRGPACAQIGCGQGAVSEDDVRLLRRVLYAFGGHDSIAVTRAEADVLFDINDATMEADNHPSWSDLFVKAVANHLMAAHGYRVPAREVALRRAEWLDDQGDGADRLIVKALAGGLKGIWQAYRRPAMRESPAAEAGIERASEAEARWLADRIDRDGRMGDTERALLTFIAEEAPAIDPALRPLIERAGIAA